MVTAFSFISLILCEIPSLSCFQFFLIHTLKDMIHNVDFFSLVSSSLTGRFPVFNNGKAPANVSYYFVQTSIFHKVYIDKMLSLFVGWFLINRSVPSNLNMLSPERPHFVIRYFVATAALVFEQMSRDFAITVLLRLTPQNPNKCTPLFMKSFGEGASQQILLSGLLNLPNLPRKH